MSVTDGLYRMADQSRPRAVSAGLRAVAGALRTMSTDPFFETIVVLAGVTSVGLGFTFALAPQRFTAVAGFVELFAAVAPQIYGGALGALGVLGMLLAANRHTRAEGVWPAFLLTLVYAGIPVAFIAAGGSPSAVWVYAFVMAVWAAICGRCATYRKDER